LGELVRDGRQRLHRRLDGTWIVAFHRATKYGDRVTNLGLVVFADLVTVLGQVLLGAIDQVVGLVSGFGQSASLLVIFSVRLSVLDHALDLVLVQPAGSRNLDRLFL